MPDRSPSSRPSRRALARAALAGAAVAGLAVSGAGLGGRGAAHAAPAEVLPLAVRLGDGLDLKAELERLVKQRGWKMAVVLGAAGSLKRATIRFAERKDGMVVPTPCEVVSLTGTVTGGVAHVHIAVAPSDGRVVGGHLLEGSPINALEVVVSEAREERRR